MKKIEPIIKGDKSAYVIQTKEKHSKNEENKELSSLKIKNIVILGEGAVGSLMASKLKALGQEKVNNVRIISKKTIGSGTITIKTQVEGENGVKNEEDQNVQVFDKREVEEKWGKSIDLLLVCCKNYQTKENLTKFLDDLPKDVKVNCVLTVQNGFGNTEQISEVFKARNVNLPIILPISLYSGVKIQSKTESSIEIIQSISNKMQFSVPANLKDTEIFKLLNSGNFEIKHTIPRSNIFKDKIYVDWEKLVINSIINPLTSIFEVKNHEIIDNPQIQSLAKMLIKEIVQILKMVPCSLDWVVMGSSISLEEAVFTRIQQIAKTTGSNVSSMLSDILRKTEKTEIDSFNGAFVNIAEELKMGENVCKINRMIVEMVKAKTFAKNKQ